MFCRRTLALALSGLPLFACGEGPEDQAVDGGVDNLDGSSCPKWDEAHFTDPAPWQEIDLESGYADPPPSGGEIPFGGLDRETVHSQCLDCHQYSTPGEVARWRASGHAQGPNPVLCLDCHGTSNHGKYIALGFRFRAETLGADGTTMIGGSATSTYAEWFPKMVVEAMVGCQRSGCHTRNYAQHVGPRRVEPGAPATTPFHGMLRYDHGISSWSDAMMSSFGLTLLDTYGMDVFREACVRCHSQTMAFNLAGANFGELRTDDAFLTEMRGRQTAADPNFAAMNLPGVDDQPLVLVRCVECHVRHAFSRSSPRQPSACAKCHSGPDHPQIEAYELSKHALVLAEHGPYSPDNPGGGPTCATCHLSPDPDATTSTTAGPAIHHDLTRGLAANFPAGSEAWRTQRALMIDRCSKCHARSYASRQLLSADEAARDATSALMAEIQTLCQAAYDRGVITPAPNPFFGAPVPFAPTFFHAQPWRSGPNRVSEIEAACWNAWREFGVLSIETGAWHFSPQHVQWRGLKVAEEFIGELRDLLAFAEAGYCVDAPRSP